LNEFIILFYLVVVPLPLEFKEVLQTFILHIHGHEDFKKNKKPQNYGQFEDNHYYKMHV
jgi:hypothetical protein